jgi:hypothetical protein
MTRTFIALLILLTLSAAGVWGQPASIDDARADFGRGDYRGALQKISKLLGPPNEPLPGDRYDLLMLKAECQLQLKDRLGSATTFKSAAKSAGDVKQLAAARANAVIVERSSNGKYTPAMSVGEQPIDIMPLESRKVAMARLEQELWSRNARDIDQAMQAESLPPIEKAFKVVADAYCLELATTGEAKQTGVTVHELGTRAYRLMEAEVTRSARAIDQMSQLASSAQAYGGGWVVSARGLLPAERDQLRERMAYLSKIQARAREYREIAFRLGGDHEKWDALVAQITDALADAEALSNQL